LNIKLETSLPKGAKVNEKRVPKSTFYPCIKQSEILERNEHTFFLLIYSGQTEASTK